MIKHKCHLLLYKIIFVMPDAIFISKDFQIPTITLVFILPLQNKIPIKVGSPHILLSKSNFSIV